MGIFMAKTETNLYRAVIDGTFEGDLVTDGKPVTGVLYPRFETTTYVTSTGVERTSPADVTIHSMPQGDEVDAGGGTSMHDARGWFGDSGWRYFTVPQGTDYPASLKIKRGKRKRRNRTGTCEGRHYQIEPLNRMTIDAYKGALDNLARAAIVRQVALATRTDAH